MLPPRAQSGLLDERRSFSLPTSIARHASDRARAHARARHRQRLLFHWRKISRRADSRLLKPHDPAIGSRSRPSVCRRRSRKATPSLSISPRPGASPANSTKPPCSKANSRARRIQAQRHCEIESRLDQCRSGDHENFETIWPAGCPTLRALSSGQIDPIVFPELLTKSIVLENSKPSRRRLLRNKFMKTKLLLTALNSLSSPLSFRRRTRRRSEAPRRIFRSTDSKGKTHSLADYKGKYVVLEWFNPECPFVKKHYGSGNMQKLQQEFTGKGVVWLTIDSSAPGKEGNLTPEQAEKTDGRLENAFRPRCCSIRMAKSAQAYGAKNTPHMFIINPEGKIDLRRRDRQQGLAESRPISRVRPTT